MIMLCICADANVSFSMESSNFSEAVGSARVCAELVAGELAIDIFAYMNTGCGTACCKSTRGNGEMDKGFLF